MNLFSRQIYLLAILLFACLSGCITSLDTKTDLDMANAEKVTCEVNGKPFEAVNGEGLLALDFVMADIEKAEGAFVLTVYAVQLSDDGGALAVGFKLGGEQVTDIQTGDTFTTWTPITEGSSHYKGVLGAVEKRPSVNTDEHIFKASSNHTRKVSLTVTEFDPVAKSISGTFHFEALDDENGTEVVVTNGQFQHVQWGDEAEPVEEE
ncbi:hypothetical protein FKX85_16385 [Echinicola soli]|uniref:Lipoprotein n=1 Tax=Echinicola soli TaxID=2591634 RepID=A0A514CL46_9BACT|nr:hypothetical protein [Echinicola soli]QDH80532.1 hypothetical protein FKX85_16385 [Echinicola soli]